MTMFEQICGYEVGLDLEEAVHHEPVSMKILQVIEHTKGAAKCPYLP